MCIRDRYSLDYIKQIFNAAIVKTVKSEVQEERIDLLMESITKLLYSNVSRGLFEVHKLIFSFLMCTSIKRNNGSILEQEWNYFIRGVSIFKGSLLPNPLPNNISNAGWIPVSYTHLTLPTICSV
eukprot:TRINITY_DN22962_c0_g1_i1.p1 TRINITY_DN22962_c0_g1~~TRINITY_DN22962_c0_g1_i1.p1  ORF type:complete len:125 (-),score=24.31 TRINITY_DN22962_c0_g1_i1:37-411(-)